MNINGYIKKNSDEEFSTLPFNYVDGLIFSELSYINFDLLLDKRKELKFKEINAKELTKDIFAGSVDANKNKVMLNLMRKSKRYGEVVVKNVKRYFSNKETNQFLALTLVLEDGTMFISYRGTDTTIIGWKEDSLMIYRDIIMAQTQALNYAKRILRNNDNKFYLGGHSKGGNLAFYTALNLPPDRTPNLIEAFSYDGPGFKEGITKFPSYISVHKRLTKFRTYNDVIGSIFNNMKKYKVVHSPGLLFGGHDPFYWQVVAKDNDFKYAKDISNGSKKYSRRIMNWIESLTYEDRKLATDALFDVFSNNETIYDLFRNFLKNILDIKKSLKKYSSEEKERLKAIIRRFFGFLIDSSNVKGIKRKQAIVDRELRKGKKSKSKVKELDCKSVEESASDNKSNA